MPRCLYAEDINSTLIADDHPAGDYEASPYCVRHRGDVPRPKIELQGRSMDIPCLQELEGKRY